MSRKCYTIPITQDPALHGGFVPSLIIEGEPGHRPMTGQGKHAMPWVWGETLEQAEATCAAYNLKHFGIDENSHLEILFSTFR